MALHPPTEDEETASGETPPVVAHGTEEDLSLHPLVQEYLKLSSPTPKSTCSSIRCSVQDSS